MCVIATESNRRRRSAAQTSAMIKQDFENRVQGATSNKKSMYMHVSGFCVQNSHIHASQYKFLSHFLGSTKKTCSH